MKKLITITDVENAHQQSGRLYVTKDALITPLAKDRAKELNVQLVVASETLSLNPQLVCNEDKPLKIAIGADHGGYYLKEELKKDLQKRGYQVFDLGTLNPDPCDYPDYAFKVAEAVSSGKADRGIMIDSVGIGSAMAANRVPGVLAAKCNNTVEARSAREHNYANVLTLGAKIIGSNLAKEIVNDFLTTSGGAERHQKRIKKILNYKIKQNESE